VEIPEQAILHAVDPTMDREGLPPIPGIPDNRGLADIGHLLDDIEFAEASQPLPLPVLGIQKRKVFLKHVVDMTKPVVGQSDTVATKGGQDAAASVMSADDDMTDLEDIDGELDHRKGVEIGVGHDVGHISVNEDLAGSELDELLSRDPTVRASDPEIVGILLDCQFLKEPRVSPPLLGGPRAIPFKEFR
jgi:hypothetical protein